MSMLISEQQWNKIKKRINPKGEKNIELAENLSKFNQVVLFGLVIGTFPSLIEELYKSVHSVKRIVFFHMSIWIVLPLLLYWITPMLKDLYQVSKKNYITQGIIRIILALLFIFIFSSDLEWQILTTAIQ